MILERSPPAPKSRCELRDIMEAKAVPIVLLATACALALFRRQGRVPTDEASSEWRYTLASSHSFAGLGRDAEGKWEGDYFFVQIADPQLGMLHDPEYGGDASHTDELSNLVFTVKEINRMRPRPKFVLVSGDLINAFPNTASPGLADRQVAAFKQAMATLEADIHLVLQPGNHDVGQAPRPEDMRRYRRRFGDDFFAFWVGGVLYVALNSQYHVDGSHVAALAEEQERWLMSTLKHSRAAQHVCILSHVPPFLGHEAEAKGWANWDEGSRRRALRAAEQANARLWLSGHLHGAHVSRSSGGVEIVVSAAVGANINWTSPIGAPAIAEAQRPNFAETVGTPALTASPKLAGLRVVRVSRDQMQHRWVTLEGLPRLHRLDELFA